MTYNKNSGKKFNSLEKKYIKVKWINFTQGQNYNRRIIEATVIND